MKLCIAGKNNIAVNILYYASKILNKESICTTLNKNDDGKSRWQKSLKLHSEVLGIKVLTLEEVQKLKDIVFLSLEYDKIIKPKLFNTKKLYNIHFSALPQYKGMYTSLLPILHGKNYSGVTLHEIDSGIDTGPIIDQEKFDISGLNSRQLYSKYLDKGTFLIKRNLENLLNGNYISTPQSSHVSTYFSKKSFDFSNTEINVYQTAYQIMQFVKALYFRVFQLATYKGHEISTTKILKTKSFSKPGTILQENEFNLTISTIDYDIVLFKDYYEELIDCCKKDDVDKASKIIQFVLDLNETNANGWNPLSVACHYGSKNVARLLINKGANVNFKDQNEKNLLMYAKDGFLKKKDPTLLKILIESGINIYDKDVYGKTIFDYTDDSTLLNFLTNYNDKIP